MREGGLSQIEIKEIQTRYQSRWKENGYSPAALGWGKGKQSLRFKKMFERFEISQNSILDIGCGFGDMNLYLHEKAADNYNYFGLDIVKEFIEEAKVRYGTQKIRFAEGEFLEYEIKNQYDYCVESGIFNHIMYDIDNYEYIKKVMEKAYKLCNIACIFDFRSNKVDYMEEGQFYNDPSVILSLAYEITNKIILDNSYMPYEFMLIIYKDSEIDFDKLCYK